MEFEPHKSFLREGAEKVATIKAPGNVPLKKPSLIIAVMWRENQKKENHQT